MLPCPKCGCESSHAGGTPGLPVPMVCNVCRLVWSPRKMVEACEQCGATLKRYAEGGGDSALLCPVCDEPHARELFCLDDDAVVPVDAVPAVTSLRIVAELCDYERRHGKWPVLQGVTSEDYVLALAEVAAWLRRHADGLSAGEAVRAISVALGGGADCVKCGHPFYSSTGGRVCFGCRSE